MGKKKLVRKQKTKTNTNTNTNKTKKMKFSKRHPKIAITIRLALVLIVVAFVIGAGIVVGMIYGMWGDDFEISTEELTLAGNSVILDKDGKLLAELSGDESRKVITLDEMSEYLPKAYIAIEDERFYEHDGVDFKRTGGAILGKLFGKGSYGGSTITQQLVKYSIYWWRRKPTWS